jgi:hypothetical protein
MYAWSNEINPAASVVPDGAGTIQSIEQEIGEMRDYIRKNRPAYNKDTAKQARFGELLEAQKKINERERGR